MKKIIRFAIFLAVVMTALPLKANTCLEFDGVEDYVNCGNNASLDITNQITIEAWINANTWKTNYWEGTILAKEQSGETGYNLRCGANGRLNFVNGISGSWAGILSSEIMSINKWYHVAGVFDGVSQKIYINGQLVGENMVTGTIGVNNQNLHIGNSEGFSGRLFDGKIDEVSIWNIARTEQEINANMNNSLTGSEPGLVAYYKFDEGSGVIAGDSAGINDGALNNMDDTDWVGSDCFALKVFNLFPADNSQDNSLTENLEITFDRSMAVGSGDIVIYHSLDDSIFETIHAISTIISDLKVTIDPIQNFEWQTNYYVLIDSTAFLDADSTYFDGIYGKEEWDFRTKEVVIISYTPLEYDEGILPDSNLEIVFNTNIIAGNGNVIIKYDSDDSIFETISASSTIISDSTITIDPSNNFELGTVYYVLIDSTAFMTTDSVYFKGIYTSNDWSFKTLRIFSEIDDGLDDVRYSSVAWGDYDNDGDLDILLTGSDGSNISKIYRNNSGVFTDINAGLKGVEDGSVAWGDYDNDGDLDILLSGAHYDGIHYKISIIYNNDNGSFTDINAGLQGVSFGSVAWGDYDNDGDLDILLTGDNGSSEVSIIYRNDNDGVFTDIYAGLEGVNNSSVAWGDYDNDGDLDILLTGSSSSTFSIIYNNDSGIFTDIHAGLEEVSDGSVAWGDYDNDGDLDILLTGSEYSIIYNNNSGIFSDINANLMEVNESSVAWGDYDNDGDLDILLTGSDYSIIYNNDSGIFTDIHAGLEEVSDGSVAWGDYDNDGDLDILLTGDSDSFIYQNNLNFINNKPVAPANLSSIVNIHNATLSWDKSTDIETPQDGLSYNLYIGTVDNKDGVNSSMSDISTGYRKVACLGNTNQNQSWTVKDLPIGEYYWSVQAIDHTFAGSEFSTEQTFVIVGLGMPQNVTTEVNNSSVTISWNAVTGAQSYYVYASVKPYSNFHDLTDFGSFNSDTDWTIPYADNKLFLYVISSTESRKSVKIENVTDKMILEYLEKK